MELEVTPPTRRTGRSGKRIVEKNEPSLRSVSGKDRLDGGSEDRGTPRDLRRDMGPENVIAVGGFVARSVG